MAGEVSYQDRLERKFLGNNEVQVSVVLDESFIMFSYITQFDDSITVVSYLLKGEQGKSEIVTHGQKGTLSLLVHQETTVSHTSLPFRSQGKA